MKVEQRYLGFLISSIVFIVIVLLYLVMFFDKDVRLIKGEKNDTAPQFDNEKLFNKSEFRIGNLNITTPFKFQLGNLSYGNPSVVIKLPEVFGGIKGANYIYIYYDCFYKPMENAKIGIECKEKAQ